MGNKLTFGELASGDMFISFPVGGDNGHGGFKGTHNIFMKTLGKYYSIPTLDIRQGNVSECDELNAVDSRGNLNHWENDAPVIKIK